MSNHWVGSDKDEALQRRSALLRLCHSIDDILETREYWFFHLREDFMKQSRVPKWSSNHLDRYVLLPLEYGFANKKDCFFISHCWRTRADPDPKGIDMALFQGDLRNQDWKYVWIDWSCLPQSPRSDVEDRYLFKVKHTVALLIQDCAMEWRYTPFEPRAWVLFEVAVYLLNHNDTFSVTDDMKPFVNHVREMTTNGVQSTLKKYRYRTTDPNDLKMLTGWMEILVIVFKAVKDVGQRKQIVEYIHAPAVGTVKDYGTGMHIDKNEGVMTIDGVVHKFTPGFHRNPADK
ncbi:hypothetical protein EC968_005195 [Mortierella alpina]|nr:hypothetical protein EC968_005195 [Mortierella alpina]